MKINITITTNEDIDIGFSTEQEVDFLFDYSGVYTGAYDATPSVGEQTLDTSNKTMLRDITIKPIPVSKVISPQGDGYTVTIG